MGVVNLEQILLAVAVKLGVGGPITHFSSPSAAMLGEQYFKKSVCVFVDNAFLLCLTSFYYLNEWSDTKLVNTIFVNTAKPALELNSYLI